MHTTVRSAVPSSEFVARVCGPTGPNRTRTELGSAERGTRYGPGRYAQRGHFRQVFWELHMKYNITRVSYTRHDFRLYQFTVIVIRITRGVVSRARATRAARASQAPHLCRGSFGRRCPAAACAPTAARACPAPQPHVPCARTAPSPRRARAVRVRVGAPGIVRYGVCGARGCGARRSSRSAARAAQRPHTSRVAGARIYSEYTGATHDRRAAAACLPPTALLLHPLPLPSTPRCQQAPSPLATPCSLPSTLRPLPREGPTPPELGA